MNPYDTEELVEQYMEFHYGRRYFDVENYPAKCAELCLALAKDGPRAKALDLGCAVGRTTFELARGFERVVGVDLSNRFVQCANHLKQSGNLGYHVSLEGELVDACTARLSDLDLDAQREKVAFFQEDACDLSSQHHGYDLIFAGNLLDRLQDPGQFLRTIHRYLNVQGVLVMSSPYTLLEEYTPRDKWLGGFVEKGENVSVLDGMKKVLQAHFELISEPMDVTFVIRETKRKYQHTIAQLSSWRRIK